MEESFVVLLAEQDSDAYATEEELTLLMEVIDTNADGLITEQDFLLFAYRSFLRWRKSNASQL
uniref:EF-hand domain-containing protein n=1 Tax=Globisporangium ultimum (strain ATCC 200006 / CBS 805.95 / DAOM BR144) TaxID=431595 RepID=K3X692_GLOUD